MSWAGVFAASLTPLGSISGDITSYILGWGPLGIAVVIAGILLYKGWGLYSPSRLDSYRASCRADLERENARLIAEKQASEERLTAEKQKAEQQRDDALQAAQTQLVPLLAQFTSATQALLPLLQRMVAITEAEDMIARREGRRDRDGR